MNLSFPNMGGMICSTAFFKCLSWLRIMQCESFINQYVELQRQNWQDLEFIPFPNIPVKLFLNLDVPLQCYKNSSLYRHCSSSLIEKCPYSILFSLPVTKDTNSKCNSRLDVHEHERPFSKLHISIYNKTIFNGLETTQILEYLETEANRDGVRENFKVVFEGWPLFVLLSIIPCLLNEYLLRAFSMYSVYKVLGVQK